MPYISVWVLIPSMSGGGEVTADALVRGISGIVFSDGFISGLAVGFDAGTGVFVFGGGLGSGLAVGFDTGVSVFGGDLGSGLDSGSDADTGVSVFGGGLSSCTGADSGDGDGDGVTIDSPELQALTTDKDKNSTIISAFWNCLRHITQHYNSGCQEILVRDSGSSERAVDNRILGIYDC